MIIKKDDIVLDRFDGMFLVLSILPCGELGEVRGVQEGLELLSHLRALRPGLRRMRRTMQVFRGGELTSLRRCGGRQ